MASPRRACKPTREAGVIAGGFPIAGRRRRGLSWAWGVGLLVLLALMAVSGWGWRSSLGGWPGPPAGTAQAAATGKAPRACSTPVHRRGTAASTTPTKPS